ncbi:hypothetical protein SJ_130 [Proteus phage SJ_PmiM]|nr:hypothetical protein SJ_130 [Proteus phage SJ_PmiM]
MTVEELKASVINRAMSFIFSDISNLAMDGYNELYYKLPEDENIKEGIIKVLKSNGFMVSTTHDKIAYHDRVKISWSYS